MRSFKLTSLAAVGFVALAGILLFQPATLAEEEAAMDGKTLFTDTHKCSLCHSVPAADIESKTKSESMKGADLGGKLEGDFETIAAYVRKEADKEGTSHKKGFKGSDEELQAIIDWLGSLEAKE